MPERSANRWSLRRGYLLAVLVLIGSLLLVTAYARSARERERSVAEAGNLAEAERIVTLLRERLLRYELGLRGGVSLFASVTRPTARQWQAYVEGLNTEGQFPGLMGLGHAPLLRGADLEQLQLEMRAAGEGLFRIRPPGLRESYAPILYLEPKTLPNQAAIGYDMYSDPLRNEAMSAARDTGQVRITAPVRLLQQAQDGPPAASGLLMYAPVYAGGLSPASTAARRIAMAGWVYAPFATQTYVSGAIGAAEHRPLISIVDTTIGKEYPIYRDAGFETTAASPGWSREIELEVYGRRWRIDFRVADTSGTGGMSDLQKTLAAGLLASLLLFAVAVALAHTQSRAERIAARMSESYRRSELRFRSAMQYSASGAALLDREGGIVEANPALETLLGASPGSLAGKTFSTLFLASGHAWDREHDATKAGETSHATRRLQRTDGDIRQVLLVASPVPGEIGSDVSELVQVEDVTDRLRAEEQVRTMNRLLEARVVQRTRELTLANRELESFAYSVSHDLRAPLRSVEGFARVVGERYGDPLGEEGRGYLARIRSAARRMDELIDAILKMSRISRDALKLVELDLGRIAGEVIADLRHDEPRRAVEVRIAPGLRAAGDAALVRDLLQNLLGNAWKFTRETPVARIEFDADLAAAPEPGFSAFLVRDNGVGFDPGYADKLFRPFQRLHDTEHFGGHGIGLASVKRIVERHGGSIEADGQPGEGAMFRFTLPHVDSADERDAQA